mmetsp:Transcript_29696/g.72281  ORF Transcript_29696/g.72281 Transcript_29696/m.72281 type:complete len:88 (-) Transcript_29696:145-408(-)
MISSILASATNIPTTADHGYSHSLCEFARKSNRSVSYICTQSVHPIKHVALKRFLPGNGQHVRVIITAAHIEVNTLTAGALLLRLLK